eukprot:CAMPEP_0177639928 /NCGR_PEP_ID=MMETSP0447-20121125/6277_1 /TAXON_ID=0 /ORGANISM="Stygamoeba regulata, Strain BSH-02190019" /LENGTH=305 /DNA_ID=CAMNT_0019141977 /DNA_START=225 /DNA_END=1142 /DNA_ORIENTATION=-
MNTMHEVEAVKPLKTPLLYTCTLGGLSAMTAACVTNPVDVVKTKLQLQGELGSNRVRGYNGVLGGMWRIGREEGLAGLYRGVSASVLREAVYSSLRLGLYEPIKEVLGATDPTSTPLWTKFLAAGTSGAIGAAISTPTDLVKVRFQSVLPGQPKPYRSTLHAFVEIFRQGGLRALYVGTNANTQRAVLLTGSQLAAYDHSKHYIINRGWMHEGYQLHLVSSVFAGLVCSITTSPIDSVKTRLMNQSSRGALYRNTFDCFVKTIRAEGPFALYKGFFSQWLRIAPHTVVSFMVFEFLRKLTGIKPI